VVITSEANLPCLVPFNAGISRVQLDSHEQDIINISNCNYVLLQAPLCLKTTKTRYAVRDQPPL
jgi:hypothetical protein